MDRFILISVERTWFDAAAYCTEHYNSSLATITSDEELEIAVALREHNGIYSDHDIWIGLTDSSLVSMEGEWVWMDGTSWYLYPHSFAFTFIDDHTP